MPAFIKPPGKDKIFPAAQAAAKAGQSDQQTIDALRETLLLRDYELGVLKDACKQLLVIASDALETDDAPLWLKAKFRAAIAKAEKALK
jgi:hypothetical protein